MQKILLVSIVQDVCEFELKFTDLFTDCDSGNRGDNCDLIEGEMAM
ncbi:hypothetical protein swp_4521 [Shewanella piezotolerans WP3]|uniref:Uncharacterized protein n=1 Tax=Shewanella piezotolerans (strain WP3 / JCM 13877) TaxID=225849 RepID=B8CUH2_SHEPW|nr:hypothetical protein swp_4521 [Shewanella piezotolerans WP3]